MSFNLSQIVQVATTVASLLPAAASMVQSVEAVVPAGTPGAQKLAMVQAGLQSVYTATNTVEMDFATLWPHLSSFITALVTIFNSFGWGKPSAPAAAAAVPPAPPAA